MTTSMSEARVWWWMAGVGAGTVVVLGSVLLWGAPTGTNRSLLILLAFSGELAFWVGLVQLFRTRGARNG